MSLRIAFDLDVESIENFWETLAEIEPGHNATHLFA